MTGYPLWEVYDARDVGLWEAILGVVAECIGLYFMIDWGSSQEVDLAGHC